LAGKVIARRLVLTSSFVGGMILGYTALSVL
jgi:hypothetical protein